MPNHSLHYIGDSAWCPYGNKSYPEIQKRVSGIIDYLISNKAEIIVIACNSATIASVEYLRAEYPIPIVGMEPGVKPAVQITKTGTIGVFATEASLAGEKFHKLVTSHAQDIRVITQPCPEFVSHVEKGELDGAEVEKTIKKYAEPMLIGNADTIVLGCTHYPFLKNAISELYPEFSLIDTGVAVAKQVLRRAPSQDDNHPSPIFKFQTTGDAEHATKLLPELCSDFRQYRFDILYGI